MTPESLIRSHQDGVYTVCLHVLRHPQDAEDAAQEALLKIAAEAGAVREPRAFKSWLYRVTWHTAVDHLRKRATRRRIEEGSAPMTPSLTEEQREAIHEAMAALPDDDRLLLVEHYFEKSTLAELGRREGVSDVAMGKRVDKAREKLKRGLAGAGILIGGSQIARALESVQPAVAPPAVASTSVLAVTGGIAMGTKTSVSASVIVGMIVILALVSGSLWWALGAPAERPVSRVDALQQNSKTPDPAATPGPSTPSTASASTIPSESGDAAACRRALASLLPFVRTTDMLKWAGDLERLHGGRIGRFEAFAREFLASARTDLIPIVKAMLAETEADTAKFLLAAVLGQARDPAGMEILKGLTQGSGSWVAQSALYSIGLIRTPEGLSFLKSTWEVEKTIKSPVAETTLKAIGLFGKESVPLLLEAANSNVGVLRDKASYLFLVRGRDAVDALRLVIETETDASVRKGAARAVGLNLESEQADVVVEVYQKYSEPDVRGGLLYGLMKAWNLPFIEEARSPMRTAIADRLLNQAAFPTGGLDVDRALIWLGLMASPNSRETLFERFRSLDKDALGPMYTQLVREVISAYGGQPDFESRLASLMDSSGITAEQREKMRTAVDVKGSPEAIASANRANLETLRASPPGDPRLSRALNNLVRTATGDTLMSPALREAYDRCSTPEARFQFMDSLSVALYSNDESVAPRTFLESVLLDSAEADLKLFAAYGYLAPGSTRPADPLVLKRIAELIGPDMRWAGESTLGKGQFRLVQVAPPLIGDYYSQFGTSSDIAWLRQLPDTFPYPQMLVGKARELLKRELEGESRRAIDAIRLRN